MVFSDVVGAEYADGIEIHALSSMPAELHPLLDTATHLNLFQFIAVCEDPSILAAVRSHPVIRKTTKALTSGFAGPTETTLGVGSRKVKRPRRQ